MPMDSAAAVAAFDAIPAGNAGATAVLLARIEENLHNSSNAVVTPIGSGDHSSFERAAGQPREFLAAIGYQWHPEVEFQQAAGIFDASALAQLLKKFRHRLFFRWCAELRAAAVEDTADARLLLPRFRAFVAFAEQHLAVTRDNAEDQRIFNLADVNRSEYANPELAALGWQSVMEYDEYNLESAADKWQAELLFRNAPLKKNAIVDVVENYAKRVLYRDFDHNFAEKIYETDPGSVKDMITWMLGFSFAMEESDEEPEDVAITLRYRCDDNPPGFTYTYKNSKVVIDEVDSASCATDYLVEGTEIVKVDGRPLENEDTARSALAQSGEHTYTLKNIVKRAVYKPDAMLLELAAHTQFDEENMHDIGALLEWEQDGDAEDDEAEEDAQEAEANNAENARYMYLLPFVKAFYEANKASFDGALYAKMARAEPTQRDLTYIDTNLENPKKIDIRQLYVKATDPICLTEPFNGVREKLQKAALEYRAYRKAQFDGETPIKLADDKTTALYYPIRALVDIQQVNNEEYVQTMQTLDADVAKAEAKFNGALLREQKEDSEEDKLRAAEAKDWRTKKDKDKVRDKLAIIGRNASVDYPADLLRLEDAWVGNQSGDKFEQLRSAYEDYALGHSPFFGANPGWEALQTFLVERRDASPSSDVGTLRKLTAAYILGTLEITTDIHELEQLRQLDALFNKIDFADADVQAQAEPVRLFLQSLVSFRENYCRAPNSIDAFPECREVQMLARKNMIESATLQSLQPDFQREVANLIRRMYFDVSGNYLPPIKTAEVEQAGIIGEVAKGQFLLGDLPGYRGALPFYFDEDGTKTVNTLDKFETFDGQLFRDEYNEIHARLPTEGASAETVHSFLDFWKNQPEPLRPAQLSEWRSESEYNNAHMGMFKAHLYEAYALAANIEPIQETIAVAATNAAARYQAATAGEVILTVRGVDAYYVKVDPSDGVVVGNVWTTPNYGKVRVVRVIVNDDGTLDILFSGSFRKRQDAYGYLDNLPATITIAVPEANCDTLVETLLEYPLEETVREFGLYVPDPEPDKADAGGSKAERALYSRSGESLSSEEKRYLAELGRKTRTLEDSNLDQEKAAEVVDLEDKVLIPRATVQNLRAIFPDSPDNIRPFLQAWKKAPKALRPAALSGWLAQAAEQTNVFTEEDLEHMDDALGMTETVSLPAIIDPKIARLRTLYAAANRESTIDDAVFPIQPRLRQAVPVGAEATQLGWHGNVESRAAEACAGLDNLPTLCSSAADLRRQIEALVAHGSESTVPWRCLDLLNGTFKRQAARTDSVWWKTSTALTQRFAKAQNKSIAELTPTEFLKLLADTLRDLGGQKKSERAVRELERIARFTNALHAFELGLISRAIAVFGGPDKFSDYKMYSWTESRLDFVTWLSNEIRQRVVAAGIGPINQLLGYWRLPALQSRSLETAARSIFFHQLYAAKPDTSAYADQWMFETTPPGKLRDNVAEELDLGAVLPTPSPTPEPRSVTPASGYVGRVAQPTRLYASR